LIQGDQPQLEKALKRIKRELMAEGRSLASQLVILETEWVLRRRYGLANAEIGLSFFGFATYN